MATKVNCFTPPLRSYAESAQGYAAELAEVALENAEGERLTAAGADVGAAGDRCARVRAGLDRAAHPALPARRIACGARGKLIACAARRAGLRRRCRRWTLTGRP